MQLSAGVVCSPASLSRLLGDFATALRGQLGGSRFAALLGEFRRSAVFLIRRLVFDPKFLSKTAFYRHDKSYVALLKIDGKTVRKVAQADVGGLAEGIAFSPDGRYLYVGNFVDGNIDILRVDGDALTKVANLALPGHPASMRGSTP